jgi:hypothetical protein
MHRAPVFAASALFDYCMRHCERCTTGLCTRNPVHIFVVVTRIFTLDMNIVRNHYAYLGIERAYSNFCFSSYRPAAQTECSRVFLIFLTLYGLLSRYWSHTNQFGRPELRALLSIHLRTRQGPRNMQHGSPNVVEV